MKNEPDNSLDPDQFDSTVLQAFKDGSVYSLPTNLLKKHVNTLCNHVYFNSGVQHRAVIMGIALSQILLRNDIQRLNRSNTIWTILAIVIALITLLRH